MSAYSPTASVRLSNRMVVTISVAVVTTLCIIVPRITPIAIAVFAMIAGGALLVWDISKSNWRDALSATFLRPEIAFVAWALVACLWASAPTAAFGKALFLATLVFFALVLAQHIERLDHQVLVDISRGLVFGFVVGSIYVFVEIMFKDAITRLILLYFPDLERGFAKHAKIRDGVVAWTSGAHMSRVSSVLCLLWCPAVLAARIHTKGVIRWVALGAIAVVTLAILFHPHSKSQTAQLTLFIGLMLIVISRLSNSAARWLAGAAFAGLLFLSVPLSIGLHAAKFHENPYLFKSAQARVIIWNYTSERILEKPILGYGTYSTRYLDAARGNEVHKKKDNLVVAEQTRAHPHNIYLHIWYELGIIGVLAFGIAGLSMLCRIGRLPQDACSLAVAHFGICSFVIASSYGLWQNWFQSAILVSILTFILVAMSAPCDLRGVTDRRRTRSAAPQPNGANSKQALRERESWCARIPSLRRR